MKQQMMQRSEPKKAKLTKMEKVYQHFEKVKRRAVAKKKETAAYTGTVGCVDLLK